MKNLIILISLLLLVSCEEIKKIEGADTVGDNNTDTVAPAETPVAPNATPAPAYVTIRRQVTNYYGYVANYTDDSIDVFDISIEGVIRHVQEIPAGDGPLGLKLHPNGKFLYVLNSRSDSISVFTVNADTAALELASTVNAGDYPHALDFSDNGDYMYVVSEIDAKLREYSVNKTTGELALVNTVSTGASPHDVRFMNNKILVANYGANSFQIFEKANGVWSNTASHQFAANTRPYKILVVQSESATASGVFFIALRGSNQIAQVTLRAGNVFDSWAYLPTCSNPTSMAMTGALLYVSCWGAHKVEKYHVGSSLRIGTTYNSFTTARNPIALMTVPGSKIIIGLS